MGNPLEDIDFEDYCKNLGFSEYPFATFTAENEKRHIVNLFTKPDIHHAVQTAINSGSSVIVYGERGTGKTALLYSIERNIPKKTLIIHIDNYERLKSNFSKIDFYDFALKNFVEQAVPFVAKNFLSSIKLSKDDRIFFSYLLKKYLTESSKARVDEKLREIQIPLYKRGATWLLNTCRNPINAAANAGVAFVSDLVRKNIPWLVNVDAAQYVEYLKQIDLIFQADFQESTPSLEVLRKSCALVKKITGQKVYFILDKIDEDDRLDNDADEISAFAKKMLSDTKHFTSDEFCFVVSIWTIPFTQILDDIRTQKIAVKSLTWDKNSLARALNKRVSHFSGGIILNYKELFSGEIPQHDEDEMFHLCNGNPRDLWHIFDRILFAQFAIDKSSKITTEALQKGKRNFVEKFNYYEYYPKKINANARSMDVYRYIALLGKLNTPEFTINSLKTHTGAGSGATNYVTKMQSMGLINSIGKDGKSNKYRVRDPKVVYAIINKIQIRKDGESIDTSDIGEEIELIEVAQAPE